MILWILKLATVGLIKSSYTCINLILWILKPQKSDKRSDGMKYKIDPMDFETKFGKSIL
ncbi:hypothetical protein CURT_0519 [Campylobacter ureolyticus]|uniref:Uncharacterized protein n=1 Tax=Campylobacter ureolyticus TaxID=827 RepID=A0AAE7E9D2_9BACT|nr:hypothetical protein CURT_0519 [Campylobacter ureolyticus]